MVHFRYVVHLLMFGLCLYQTSGGHRARKKQFMGHHLLHERRLRPTSVALQRRRGNATILLSHVSEPTPPGETVTYEITREVNTAQGTTYEITREVKTAQGTRLLRVQEKYKGTPVFDGIVTVTTDNSGSEVLDKSDIAYRRITLDTDLDITAEYTSSQVLDTILAYNLDQGLRHTISNVKIDREIFRDDQGRAYPGYLVQYLVLTDNAARRPTCIVDARSRGVISCWDAINQCPNCSAKGTGGNLRIGKIHYGELQRCLDVRKADGRCYTENRYVRVINNNMSRRETYRFTDAASYDCVEAGDAINGAFSPLLDALFYGTVIGRMFEDWYNMTTLPNQMQFRVHFGRDFSGSLWNGFECVFGDGDDVMYPWVVMDIVGHEVGHAVTEMNSGLVYFGQPGGIDEAFSDMCGETAQAYLSEADWVVGVEMMKRNDPPLRFFENPEDDNMSIAHVSNYTDDLGPHYSSGVYNRVFYILVRDFQLPIKNVFHVFLLANRMYWHNLTTFASGACDVMKAAYDLGQDGSRFREAFRSVGIDVCSIERHVLGLGNRKIYREIVVSKDISPMFTFSVPGEIAESVFVYASSTSGAVYITLTNRTWDSGPGDFVVYGEGFSSVQYGGFDKTTFNVTITLSTMSLAALTDVTLVAAFMCLSDPPVIDDIILNDIYQSLYWKNCY